MLVQHKGRLTAVSLAAVAVLAAAFVVTRPSVNAALGGARWSVGRTQSAVLPPRLSGLAQPTSIDFYAAGGGTFGEPVLRVAAVSVEPTSVDFYAAGQGTFDEPRPGYKGSSVEPSSADFYAAGQGTW